MTFWKLAAGLLLLPLIGAAQMLLPALRVEPTGGGSIFYVHNVSPQPLTAFLIELVNYPGSHYALWQDDITSGAVESGGEQRIRVANMTVGAVPDYVKLEAAIYADGTAAGAAEKVNQLLERRRFLLATTRELIGRMNKAEAAATAKEAVAVDLKNWANSLQPVGKANRMSQAGINQAGAKSLIEETAAHLDEHSVADTLAWLRASEKALAESKPSL